MNRFVCAIAVVSLLSLARPVAADLLVNGGFEAPNATSTFVGLGTGDNFGGNGWTVYTGTVDHIGGLWQAAEGTQSLDLNGGNAGGIYQVFATTPGQAYTIRFALAGNPGGYGDKEMEVLWDGTQIADLVFHYDPSQTPTSMGWTYEQVTAVATGNSVGLAFHSLTGAMDGSLGFAPYYGPALDDISVTEASTSTTPEPTSLALLSIGAIGLAMRAAYRRRRPARV